MSHEAVLQELILNTSRELAVIEAQIAEIGRLNVPAPLLLEAERLKVVLTALQNELAALRAEKAAALPPPADTVTPAQCMKIAREMRYSLPNQTYLEFVGRFLMGMTAGTAAASAFDPFAPIRQDTAIDDIYVIRPEIEADISRSGTRIIMGADGSGRTFLFKNLPQLLPPHHLIVSLSPNELNFPGHKQAVMEGQVSWFTPQTLPAYIFEAYWQQLFMNTVAYEAFYRYLRRHQSWRDRLHWFYQRHGQVLPQPAGEFELLGWLNCCAPPANPFAPAPPPENMLGAMIDFVTTTVSADYVTPPVQPYAQIQVLIDGVDSLSAQAAAVLIHDVQWLFERYPYQIQVKLFVPNRYLPQIEAADFVRRGRAEIYHIPPWNETELRRLLSVRLNAGVPGAGVDSGGDETFDWGTLIPERYLEPAAQLQLVDIIIKNGANPPLSAQWAPELSPPQHTLNLARALVAACAGCWAGEGFSPPLSAKKLEALAHIYYHSSGE